MDLLTAIDRENGAFLAGNEFGEVGTFTPVVGAVVKMQCIFDLASEEVELGATASLDGASAVAAVESALVPGAAHGDAFSVRNVDYRIVGIEPDGTGMTRLILSR